MTYSVLKDRIAIQLEEPWTEERQHRGLFVPEGVKFGRDEPVWATVLAKGPEVREEVDCGDRVLVGRFAGAPLNWDNTDGEKHIFVIRQFEMLAKEV